MSDVNSKGIYWTSIFTPKGWIDFTVLIRQGGPDSASFSTTRCCERAVLRSAQDDNPKRSPPISLESRRLKRSVEFVPARIRRRQPKDFTPGRGSVKENRREEAEEANEAEDAKETLQSDPFKLLQTAKKCIIS